MLAWTRELTSRLRSGHHCQHAAARFLMGLEARSRMFDPQDRCVQAVVFSTPCGRLWGRSSFTTAFHVQA